MNKENETRFSQTTHYAICVLHLDKTARASKSIAQMSSKQRELQSRKTTLYRQLDDIPAGASNHSQISHDHAQSMHHPFRHALFMLGLCGDSRRFHRPPGLLV